MKRHGLPGVVHHVVLMLAHIDGTEMETSLGDQTHPLGGWNMVKNNAS